MCLNKYCYNNNLMRLFFAVLLASAALCQQQDFKRLPDLVYARYGARDLRLDLYLPGTGAGPFPAVVYIHGGGWSAGNKSAFQRQAAYMAGKGFVGACIEYRLSGEAQYPAAVWDAKAAVRWMRAQAGRYHIDPNRIGAAGGSAGGHLVAMLGATAGIKRLEGDGGNSGFSSAVQAVAAFNPALDLVSWGKAAPNARDNPVAAFLGATYAEKPAIWAEASPINHAGRNCPPFLFLHGDADTTVPYRQSVEMMGRLKAAGVRAEIFTAPGAAHAFFNRPPWFQPTLDRMLTFFTATLR